MKNPINTEGYNARPLKVINTYGLYNGQPYLRSGEGKGLAIK